MKLQAWLGATALVLGATGCATGQPCDPRPTAAPHTDDGCRFRNLPNADALPSKDAWTIWSRFFTAKKEGTVPVDPIPVRPLTRAQLDALDPAANHVVRLGHSSHLLKLRGRYWLIDPVFSERASPLQWVGPKRFHAPPLTLDQLPAIEGLILSHDHYDHLDVPTISHLAQRVQRYFVPLGLKAWMQEQGISHVEELDWWQERRVAGVDFALTPVQHWSARGLSDHNHSLWGGWAVLGPDFHWYFSGDTGYSSDFVATRERLAPRQGPAQGGGFDLALIAIGAYAPRWFMKEQHVDPDEAVQVHLDLGAKRSIGVHWGTFLLSDEALDQPPKDLARARQARGLGEADFSVMALGETRRLPRRTPSAP